MHVEMEALVDAGLTPMQAIQASTKWAAELLHQERDLGTIAPARIADIILNRSAAAYLELWISHPPCCLRYKCNHAAKPTPETEHGFSRIYAIHESFGRRFLTLLGQTV